jgi:hypothetical protein
LGRRLRDEDEFLPIAAARDASKDALGTLWLFAITLEITVSISSNTYAFVCDGVNDDGERTYSKLPRPTDLTHVLSFRSHCPEAPGLINSPVSADATGSLLARSF